MSEDIKESDYYIVPGYTGIGSDIPDVLEPEVLAHKLGVFKLADWAPAFGLKPKKPSDWFGYYCMLDHQVRQPVQRKCYKTHRIDVIS